MSKYELLSVTGEGATAISHLARTEDGKEVLVKRFKTPLQYQKESIFSREVEVLCGLDHPQIPQYIDHYIEKVDGRSLPHIVQEFIHGEVLADRIMKKPPNHQEILAWLAQILQILSYLHKQTPPIIHRDIKPSNLLLTSTGTLVLIDFGLAVDDQARSMGHSLAVGTLGYQAPEQISGDPSTLSDLYSVGAMAVELWTKKKLIHMLNGMHLRWEEHCLGLPIPIQKWLDKMLAAQPQDRFSHVDEALQQLCHRDIQDVQKEDVDIPDDFLQKMKAKKQERVLEIADRSSQWHRLEAVYLKEIYQKRKEDQFELQRMIKKEKTIIAEMEKAWVLGMQEVASQTIELETLLEMMRESFFEKGIIEAGEIRIFVRHELYLLQQQIDHSSCSAYHKWCRKYIDKRWLESTDHQSYQGQLQKYEQDQQGTAMQLLRLGFWGKLFYGWKYRSQHRKQQKQQHSLQRRQAKEKERFSQELMNVFWEPIAKKYPEKIDGLFFVPMLISQKEREVWTKKENIRRKEQWHSAGLSMPKSHNLEFIPAGTFVMGKKYQLDSRKKNRSRNVTLTKSFWMSSYVCTQEMYHAIMHNNPSKNRRGGRYPVDSISWFDALFFCNQLSKKEGLVSVYQLPKDRDFASPDSVQWDQEANGYRLPTSAEWEYVARAGSYFFASGSSHPKEVAWFRENSQQCAHPVGEKKSNCWGIFDLSGNIWEWVFDGYDSRTMFSSNGTDVVSLKGKDRIHRGGGFLSPRIKLDITFFDRDSAHFCSDDVGFRVVRNA